MALLNPPSVAEHDYQVAHIHDDRSQVLVAAMVITLVLAFSGVTARLYSRHLIQARLQLDDYLILVSLFITTGFCIELFVYLAKFGLARHEILVPNVVTLIIGITVGEIVYTIAILFIKASICTFFYRIFPVRWFRVAQVGIVVFVFAYTAAQIICILLACIPLRAIWDSSVQATCIDINAVYLVISILNIVTDILIVALPMPLLWSLKVKMTVKIQLSSLFGLGALVCIMSIIRVTTLNGVKLVDASYSDVPAMIWSSLELGVGTLGASLPTCGPILRYIQGGRAAINPSKPKILSEPRSARSFPSARCTSEPVEHANDMFSDQHPFGKPTDDEEISMTRLERLETPQSPALG